MNSNGPSTDPDDRGAPLSVALVSPGWPPSEFANGINPYVRYVSEGLRPLGHRVTVVAEQSRGEPGEDVVDASTFRRPVGAAARLIESIAYRAAPSALDDRWAVRALVKSCRRLIAERGVQVLEMEESFGRVARVARALPIPVVVKLHGPWFINGPGRDAPQDAAFRRRVRREGEAIGGASLVVAPSRDILDRTRAYYGLALEGAEVIPLPTEIVPEGGRWEANGADPSTILFVGRFDKHKGGDLVIDAFAEVARRDDRARLRFVGPDHGLVDDSGRSWRIGPYIEHRLGEGRAGGRCEWLGPMPGKDLPGARRGAGLVVVGSRYDNFPNTVLEAMSMGCPLVAPRIGGIPEMVEDGVNGLLYEAGRPLDMAEKILRLLGDRPLASRLGARAGADCERRFAPVAVARQVADSYRRAIDAHRRASRGGAPR